MSEVQDDKKTQTTAPPVAQNNGPVAVFQPPRLPYHRAIEERFGVDAAGWRALCEAVWPLAQSSDAVVLALSYCKARKLDPFKKVVHIVPMWNSALGRNVETVWPGIAEHRTTAFRTGQYAGADPTAFGPMIEKTFTARTKKGDALSATVKFPEWAQVTVYRMVNGVRVAFPGPRTMFEEWYGLRKGAEVPNERWARAPSQMLEKCAEAAALRKAFPEELGDETTAEEAEGRLTDVTPPPDSPAPPRPARDVPPEPDDAAQTEADRIARRVAAGEVVDAETGEVIQPEEGAQPTESKTSEQPKAEAPKPAKKPVDKRAQNADPLVLVDVNGQARKVKTARDFYLGLARMIDEAGDADVPRLCAANRIGIQALPSDQQTVLIGACGRKGHELTIGA